MRVFVIHVLLVSFSFIAVSQAARQVKIDRQFLGRRLSELEDFESGSHDNERDKDEEGTEDSDKRSLGRKRGKAPKVVDQLKNLLNLEPNENLLEKRTFRTTTGVTKAKYQETFKGIPVFDTIVTAAKTDFTDVAGYVWQDIDSDVTSTTPRFTEQQALDKAKAAEGDTASGVRTSQEEIKLLIYTDEAGKAYLAYMLNYFSASPRGYKRPYYVIDAIKGNVLESWQGLAEIAHTIRYDGGNKKTKRQPRDIEVDKDGVECSLKNPKVIGVTHMNGHTDDHPVQDIYKFKCAKGLKDEANGHYSPLGDGMFFATETAKMYKTLLDLNPPDITKVGLRVFVHQSKVPDQPEAYWNRAGAHFTDGTKQLFPPFAMDSVAHELSHGFTEKYSELLNQGGTQHGGINEAFSDIAGEVAEKMFKGECDWKVAVEIIKTNFNGLDAIRYFDNPKQDGNSINTAEEFDPTKKEHHLGGPYRQAFYNLVTKQRWDMLEAFKVFAKANMNYWRVRTGYNEGLCCLRAAAHDHFDTNIDKQKQVDLTAAFNPVKIYGCENYGSEILLQRGVPKPLGNLRQGESQMFEFFIPASCERMEVTLNRGRGQIEIFEKRGSVPTEASHENKETGNGDVTLTVKKYQGGELAYLKEPASHFVMVKAVEDATGYEITADFRKYTG